MHRAREPKRWRRRAGIAVALLILLFVIDVATGSFALYGWQVPVVVQAVDASTGAPIKEATVSYAYTFDDSGRYEPLRVAATGPTVRMTYCRGGGVISNLFRGAPRPDLSMYRFEVVAPGFTARRIDATEGELFEDSRRPEREQLALRLPDVTLERWPGA